LLREAERRGVGANRIIFAKPLPQHAHLARQQVADLFLDTLPYNAHTGASDALWAGLPVLTRIGEAFAARVAASLLTAIDMPELIVSTQEHYEALAIEIACNPEKLAAIKAKLTENRLIMPLFDTQLFTGFIETAYIRMYQRYRDELPPADIYI